MGHLVDMMEQVKRLKNGSGVQNLLDSAYKILGNPIVMFNTEYNLLAYTEVVTDDPVWNEIVTNGTFCKETQLLFESEGFIEEIVNTPKGVLLKSKKLKYDRISGKIFNKNNAFVSNLVIVACKKPFEENDPIVFEAICKLISREISSSELYQEYEQTHQEAVIKNLIDGNCDRKLDMAQVGILYDSLKSGLYIAVADISGCGPECADIVYVRNLLKQIAPDYKYAVYSEYIVIIISTNDESLNVNQELNGLIKAFGQKNIYAGISSRFENLFELQKYYQEALKAMQYVFETGSEQRIFPCRKDSMDKMEQIERLKNGEGIQYFLDSGADIFGNPLLFHDMELNLLAYSEHMEISDPIWQELITYGTSSDETIELFRTEGFIDIMDNTKSGAVLISEKIKYDRISWRIYNNDNIRIGCTSIVNTIKPFSEDELVLFGAFSQRFSKEVGKIGFYDNYGQIYSGTVINRLISGKIDDYTFYSEDIGNLYDKLTDNLYLLAVDMTLCGPEQANLTYFRNMFHWPGTVSRYAIYSKYIIIIISIDDALLGENNELDEVNRLLEQNNIYAGISSCFGNVYELPKYYNEAVSALNSGMKNKDLHSKQQIFRYDRT